METALITSLQALKALPEADKALIIGAFRPMNFKEGEFLFEGGKICREMYFIRKGVLRLVSFDEKGNDITYFFLKENQFCTNLDSFLNERPAANGIQAACDAEVMAITRAQLFELYAQLPYLKSIIESLQQQQLLQKIELQNAYHHKDAAARYQLFTQLQPEVARQVKLQDVASYLGIAPQSLSRLRKQVQ
ncbi:CRP-like cAMP-binding protein [Mucilaginibacter yixingensis]|uniref:CRP-like cAMP-binding protein n=1 Tax=Mucilaginibacter yixingensis TaxID=1295612 RepID=A0A2T5JGX4_9SPHI|nr:Crp/Fnr family transcriptional regulator [Mucilaginibacter yixingensis]PTR01616.1 CRP-like cAMP-binding protein [Mucilaginibacter yixingensis]